MSAYYALADVLASKSLTKRTPRIKRATAYVAEGVADGLEQVKLRGEVPIDPRTGELFQQVVEARQRVRADKRIPKLEREARQRSLKVFSNSGSYGIFAQFTPKRLGKPKTIELFSDRRFSADVQAPEDPGPYCFPPLAAFTTAAARLLLALLEHYVEEAGGSWLCTDTDSMAILTDYGELERSEAAQRANRRPGALPVAVVDQLIERFRALWPYRGDGNILKLEAENFDRDTGERRPLYGIAIAAKRYALLNFDVDGNAIIRKRSEHGLGLYTSPYGADDKTRRWIDELWENIVAEILGRPVPERPWEEVPVVGKVPVTSWQLLDSFADYNRTHPNAPVRPFNFVSAAYLKPLTRAEPIRLFAPFVSEPAKAQEAEWYDHNTGLPVKISTNDPQGTVDEGAIPVKTFGELARQYAKHPEVKFADSRGERCSPDTTGTLVRRHIVATKSEAYGKEGTVMRKRIEGASAPQEAQALYPDPGEFDRFVLPVARTMPRRPLAEAARMTERGLRKILNGYSRGTPSSRARITEMTGLWAAWQLRRRSSPNPIDDCAAFLASESGHQAKIGAA